MIDYSYDSLSRLIEADYNAFRIPNPFVIKGFNSGFCGSGNDFSLGQKNKGGGRFYSQPPTTEQGDITDTPVPTQTQTATPIPVVMADWEIKLLTVAIVRENVESEQWAAMTNVFLNRLTDMFSTWSCGALGNRKISCILGGSDLWFSTLRTPIENDGFGIENPSDISETDALRVWDNFDIPSELRDQALPIVANAIQTYPDIRYRDLYMFGHHDNTDFERRHVECLGNYLLNDYSIEFTPTPDATEPSNRADMINVMAFNSSASIIQSRGVFRVAVVGDLIMNTGLATTVRYGGNLDSCSSPATPTVIPSATSTRVP